MATAMVGLGALRFQIDALNFSDLERSFAYRMRDAAHTLTA